MKRRDILCALPAFALTGMPVSAGGVTGQENSAVAIGRWLIANRILPADGAALSAVFEASFASASARATVEADFAAGRVVSVDGWFISETEARLCALAAVKADQGAVA